MNKSMTGYGLNKLDNEQYTISAEIKTLNSKFLDINIRLPKTLNDKEIEIRNLLNDQLDRGKVSMVLEYTRKDESASLMEVNKDLFKKYYSALNELADEVNGNKDELMRLVLQMPDVINTSQNDELLERDWPVIREVITKAIKACDQFRMQEGKAVSEKLESYIENIRTKLEEVVKMEPERLLQIKERINNSLKEVQLKDQIDQNRFEQEMIYYIEKLDISEEKQRLLNHLDYFIEILNDGTSQGKKLNFIGQEIGREINTMGSKASHSGIQKLVINMKDELEKIKEQLLNII